VPTKGLQTTIDLGGCVAAAKWEEKEEEGRGAGFGCGWIEADLRMGLRLEGRERRGEGSGLCGGRRDWGGVDLQRSNE
jgi:hypothetical protein